MSSTRTQSQRCTATSILSLYPVFAFILVIALYICMYVYIIYILYIYTCCFFNPITAFWAVVKGTNDLILITVALLNCQLKVVLALRQ